MDATLTKTEGGQYWPIRELACGLAISLATVGVFWSPITASILLMCLGFIGGFFQLSSVFLTTIFFLPLNLTIRSDVPISDISSCFRIALLLGLVMGDLVAGRSVLGSQWKLTLNRFILGYLVIVIVSIGLEKPVSLSSLKALFHLVSYLAFYLAMVEWLTSEDRIHATLKVLLYSSILVAVFGVIQALSGGYTEFYFLLFPNQSKDLVFWDGRVTSFLNYSNSLAGYVALVIPVALAVKVVPGNYGIRPLLSTIALIGDLAVLLLSESRGGLAAVAASFALALVLLGTKLQKIALTLSIIAFAVILYLWSDRQQYQTLGYDSSLVTRAVIFLSAWQMFRQAPVLGVGYGNFKELFDSRILQVDQGTFDVHNLYLQHLAEVGVVGFVAFFAILFVAIKQGYTLFKRSASHTARCVGFLFLAALAAMLIHGFVDFLFNVSPPVGALFWCLFALLVAVQRVSNRTAF